MADTALKYDFDAWDKEASGTKSKGAAPKTGGFDFDSWDKEAEDTKAIEGRGILGDVVSGAVRGATVEMPGLFLDAAGATERIARKALGFDQAHEVGPIGEFAKSGKAFLEDVRSEHPILRAKKTPGIIEQGVEAATMSLASGAPGALIGFGLGSLGGPLSPVTAPMGALIGFALSGGMTFGLAEYESVIQMADEQGFDRRESEPAAIISGIAEGGFEFLSDLITGGLLKVAAPLSVPAKEALKTGFRHTFKMGM